MFVKIIYRHFVFNQEKYQVCKFRIYRHFVKSVNGSNFPVDDWVSDSYNYISRQVHDQENHGIRRKRQKWFKDYVITRFEKVKYKE